MSDRVLILYPSGSHGKFLELILNSLAGIRAVVPDNMIYDFISFEDPPIFLSKHHITNNSMPVINIRVKSIDYLRYSAVCLNRVAGCNIILEDLHINTYNKLSKHPIFLHFIPPEINVNMPNCEIKNLREWARLLLFSNNGSTITQWVQTSVCPTAEYYLDYESFYNGSIITDCIEILRQFDIELKYNKEQIDAYLSDFHLHNKYKNIDIDIDIITDSIKNCQNIKLPRMNFLKEAWLDNWLVSKYNISPLLQNQYWDNTQQIIKGYNLNV